MTTIILHLGISAGFKLNEVEMVITLEHRDEVTAVWMANRLGLGNLIISQHLILQRQHETA